MKVSFVNGRNKKNSHKNDSGFIQSLIDRYSHIFHVIDSSISSAIVLKSSSEKRKLPIHKISLSIIFIVLILFFLNYEVYLYSTKFPPKEYLSEDVLNLTKENVVWDVFYGKSKKCGEIDCFLKSSQPKELYKKQMVLPAKEFPLKDYRLGEIIYLRTQIELPEFTLEAKDSIILQTFWIWAKNYQFYIDENHVASGEQEFVNITLPPHLIKDKKVITLAFRIDPGNLPYQGLANRGEIVLGRKSAIDHLKHDAVLEETNYHLWGLLPKLAVIVVFCFMFIVFPWNREFFSFIMFALCSSLRDFLITIHYPKQLFGDLFDYYSYSYIPDLFASLFFMLFIRDFFRIRSRQLNRFFSGLFLVISLFIISEIVFVYSAPVRDVVKYGLKFGYIIFGIFGALVSASILKERAQSQTRINISIALLAVFMLELVFTMQTTYSSFKDLMGWNYEFFSLNLDEQIRVVIFFIISAISSIEFGMTQNAKERLKDKLETVEARLELGRSVQKLLLPSNLSGNFGEYTYNFFYEPAEQMSGDWLLTWEFSPGELRLLFGDVVGKGPQAALAVSAIVSTVHECKKAELSMEDAIKKINKNVYELFDGSINTTCTAVVLNDNGDIDIFTCGSFGWIGSQDSQFNVHSMRSGVLGFNEEAQIGHKTLRSEEIDQLFSFTDGCIDGPRAVKKLVRQLKSEPTTDFEELKDTIITVGAESALKDDKTILVLQKKQPSGTQNVA